MSAINWPADFDPARDRAYLNADGKPVFARIPPEVLALPLIEPAEGADPFGPRYARARDLAGFGYVIDTQIDVWGWGAENTMRLRRLYGKASVPDALGNTQILVPPAR